MELPYIPFRTFVSKTAPLRMSQKPLPPMPAKSQHRRASSVYSQCLPPHSAMTLPTSVADSLRITNALLETVEFSRSTSCLPEQHPVTPPLLEAKVYRPPNASSSSLSSHSDSEINFPLPAVYLEAGTYSPSLQVFSLSSANSSINENHLCEDEDQAAGSPPELLHAPLGTGKLCHASRATAQSAGSSPLARAASTERFSTFFQRPATLRSPRVDARSREGGDGLAALGPMEVVAAPLEPERRGARARSERRKGLYGKGLGIGVSVGSSIRALGQLGGEEVRAERRREEMKQRIRLVGTVDPSSVSFKVVDLPARD
ncbi:hypothetical protein FH972_026361 [Carpinus fangiana]|uniref:Uncharacterized protein n=1 Tax=Carpinus fangiana TaxID=176857 RepID=A0A5N6L3R4_9ROSI|nr:hypothetical protein FH972_026361 [Carpinus fangiana]